MKVFTPLELFIEQIEMHIEKHKQFNCKFDTGAMIAKNYATSLLDAEKQFYESIYQKGKKDALNEINIDKPKCKCIGYGYCYAKDKNDNVVRPCILNETFKSE